MVPKVEGKAPPGGTEVEGSNFNFDIELFIGICFKYSSVGFLSNICECVNMLIRGL